MKINNNPHLLLLAENQLFVNAPLQLKPHADVCGSKSHTHQRASHSSFFFLFLTARTCFSFIFLWKFCSKHATFHREGPRALNYTFCPHSPSPSLKGPTVLSAAIVVRVCFTSRACALSRVYVCERVCGWMAICLCLLTQRDGSWLRTHSSVRVAGVQAWGKRVCLKYTQA